MACIVECQDSLSSRVVALATGTKCFPQNVASRLDSIVDCHAESLLKRAFKLHLIELINQWTEEDKPIDQFYEQGECRSCLTTLLSLYRLVIKPREYTLFVSQTPCGCVSRWQGDAKQKTEPEQSDLRTYKRIGINRKPGRGDLCPKVGCIHKLAKWNIFGLQGRFLFGLIGKAVTLQRIVVGNCEQHQNEFISEMNQRLAIDLDDFKLVKDQLCHQELFNFETSTISIQLASQFRFDEFVREANGQTKKPSGSSIVAWLKGR